MIVKVFWRFFFLARYLDQRPPRENSCISFLHKMIIMSILNLKPIELSTRPVKQLMYLFMPLPLNQLGDRRRFLVAYELEDPKPRRHLLVPGQPSHCPPFFVAGDVMVLCAGHGGPHNMVAIRHVLAKNSQQPPWTTTTIFCKRMKIWLARCIGCKPPNTTVWKLEIRSLLTSECNILLAFLDTKRHEAHQSMWGYSCGVVGMCTMKVGRGV
jgi:hypothetical protein